jgi:hypothetical protein
MKDCGELDPSDEVILTQDISDEALESAATCAGLRLMRHRNSQL